MRIVFDVLRIVIIDEAAMPDARKGKYRQSSQECAGNRRTITNRRVFDLHGTILTKKHSDETRSGRNLG